MRIPRLSRGQIIKLARLLDMQYKPAEIAEEIGVTADTVYRSYLPAGAPHQRDAQGNIWLHGLTFKAWALNLLEDAKSDKVRQPLAEGFAWCMRCKAPARIMNPRTKKTQRNLEFIQGTCETCGGRIFRARSLKTPGEAHRKPAKAPKPQGA